MDNINILWEYETQTFPIIIDNKKTSYTPDFYLPETDMFIEIKGWMRTRDQKKINKTVEQYNINLIILYRKDLIELGIKIK